jgi:O-antigen/teichoic acid export membrane protein
MPSNTARIAKNTLMLYFRQILIMLVSLYTVRVVLNTLGAEYYGIYNVVAGVVTMFRFLSHSMSGASQRYFSFEIGKNDFKQLKKIFSLNLTIFILISLLVLVLAETIGLWFVSNKLAIPIERKIAAQWIYQFSIVSFLFSILTTPYMAAIIAHEDMNIYAYVSIVEVTLKLGIVFILRLIAIDKLQLYGFLMCAVTIINTAIYRTICTKKYQECKFGFYFDKVLFKEITSYIGWSLFGSLTTVIRDQAVTILLNQFFNPLVIAARSIASSVNSAASSFSYNFSTALRPQIIKSYSSGQKTEMIRLISGGSKSTYFLMYLFVLPLVLEMPTVLAIWLKNVPDYAVVFTRLALIDVLINSISFPLMTAARAPGKIKIYESVLGSIQLASFFIAWIVLMLGAPAYSVMIVTICISVAMFIVRLVITGYLVGFSIRQFLYEAIVPACMVTIVSAILPVLLFTVLQEGLLRLFIVIAVSILSVCGCMYTLGLNTAERKRINEIIINKINGVRYG